MKNQSKKILSLLSFTLFILGCSRAPLNKQSVNMASFSSDIEDSDFLSKPQAKWFSKSEKFAIESTSEEESIHMFFDMDPSFDSVSSTISFIALTPQGSDVEYSLDLVSGQHYVSDMYCAQDDIWKSYKETIYKPPFTLGVIPSVLDETGKAQKIIVFSDTDYYSDRFLNSAHDVKIIGGYIEQYCPTGTCLQLTQWKNRFVLVGIAPSHESFEQINNLASLQKVSNWALVEAFIHNGQGVNKIAGSFYPAYRISRYYDQKGSLEYFKKNTTYLSKQKLSSIQKNCFKLYDMIYEKIYKDSEFEKKYRNKKIKNPSKLTYTKRDFFYYRFKKYFQKYHKQYKTCSRYVYPSNINHDPQRHWFFSYFQAFHLLHEMGHTFNCSRGNWEENPLMNNGKRYRPLSKEFYKCGAKAVDTAFEKAPSYLSLLRKKELNTFRYVDYDRGSKGTHNKLYSWVKSDDKMLRCNDSSQREKFLRVFHDFPKDVNWKRKRLNVNTRGRLIK